MKLLLKKFLGYLNNFYIYRVLASKYHRYRVSKNPEQEANRVYKSVFKKNVDFENPKDLIEKIFWMQLHSDTTLWTKCADKYRMREYVESVGLSKYLPNLYKVWGSATEIKLDDLPSKFVMKTNHGCGTVLVVNDKSILNERKIRRQMKEWLSIPFGYSGCQLHYLGIKTCAIVEELLEMDEFHKKYSPNSLIDYKVWCINGEPQGIQIIYDRRKSGYCVDMYDTNWNKRSDLLNPYGNYEYRNTIFPRPDCLNKVLGMARILSKPFPEVRVDFFIINNRPYIGELTFSAGIGNLSYDYYLKLGNMIDLTKLKEK